MMNFLIEDKRPVSFLGGFPPPPGKGSSSSECFLLARSARCVWSWWDCWEPFRVLSLIFMGTSWTARKGRTSNTHPLSNDGAAAPACEGLHEAGVIALPMLGAALSGRAARGTQGWDPGHGSSTQHIPQPATAPPDGLARKKNRAAHNGTTSQAGKDLSGHRVQPGNNHTLSNTRVAAALMKGLIVGCLLSPNDWAL